MANSSLVLMTLYFLVTWIGIAALDSSLHKRVDRIEKLLEDKQP